MAWNPETYLAFAGQRTRPAADLLTRVPVRDPARVIDLGCGPGNSAALLAARWPKARLEGLDSSAAMLAQARASGVPAIWVEADLGTWSPEAAYDVIYSNATFQWVPDQEVLLPRLMSLVKPGGAFAFQVPVNFNAPSHVLLYETASELRFRDQLKNVQENARGYPDAYYAMLKPHAATLDIWESEYLQVLEGEDAVYHWVSGTASRPYVQALAEDARADFIAAYKAKLAKAYPRRADGATLFAFKRLFVVALK